MTKQGQVIVHAIRDFARRAKVIGMLPHQSRKRRGNFSHSLTRRVKRRTMDSGEPEAKRHKNHEAHLIPGLSNRIWGFPNSIITKMRYCDTIVHISTTGSLATNVFQANGIFDPDVSGAGHQPLYRDTYAAIYDQYVVIGSKIKMVIMPKTLGIPVIAGIVTDDDSTLSTTLSTRMEQNNSIWAGVANGEAAEPTVLTATFEPLMYFGVDAKDDGTSTTAVGADPTESIVYGCYITAVDGVTSVTCHVAYEIEYTVKFSELKTPTQS